MRCFLSLAVIAAVFALTSAAIDCNNNPCTKKKLTHTLCAYSNPAPAAACGTVQIAGLTDQDRSDLLKKHNDLRHLVASGGEKRGKPGPQPPASDMEMMTWDSELEEVAQRWANQCNFGHDKCRDVDRFYVGQNVGITMTTLEQTNSPTVIVQSWYDEVDAFDSRGVSKYRFSANVGHYTQLVWAKSTKLGCGKVIYKNGKFNALYVVCNYGPGGNILNNPIYNIRH